MMCYNRYCKITRKAHTASLTSDKVKTFKVFARWFKSIKIKCLVLKLKDAYSNYMKE